MMKKAVTALLILFSVSVYSVSPDQTNLGILANENKFNIEFINICASNLLGPVATTNAQGQPVKPEDLDAVKESVYFKLMMLANQHDFNGNMWLYQSNYSLAFKELRAGRESMKELYRVSLEKYISSARTLLEYTAPEIIRSNDRLAKSLLKLGFRDLKDAENHFTLGYNTSPKRHRKKIILYIDGHVIARRARKYAILAMLAAKTPDLDKEEFRFVTLDDAKKTVVQENISDYQKIRDKLITFIANKSIEQKIVPQFGKDRTPIDIAEIHDDNYGFITKNRVSLLEVTSRLIKNDDANRKELIPERPDEKKE